MTRTSSTLALATLAALGLAASGPRAAHAQVVPFTGEDLQPNANPTVRVNSDAAAAAFDAAASALGTESVITFESAPVGNVAAPLTLAPGVTLTGANGDGSALVIRNVAAYTPYPSVGGTNTTVGGANYLDLFGGTATFTFATPIQAFGAYLTGVQTNFFQDTITFSDGTSQTINAPGAGTSGNQGALDFVGFTDPGKSISLVTITGSTPGSFEDEFGIDDVRYVAAAPEPSQLAGLGIGLLGLAGLFVKARKRA